MNEQLTADEVRILLSYDRDTGIFRWAGPQRKGVCLGKIASNHDNYGYVRIRVNRVGYRAHRLAWLYVYGQWPNGVIDHINGDPGDNRICNLRDATRAQNQANMKKAADNTSGFKGVAKLSQCKYKLAKPWRAYCRGRHLGLFAAAEEAHLAYRRAADENYGKFARYG